MINDINSFMRGLVTTAASSSLTNAAVQAATIYRSGAAPSLQNQQLLSQIRAFWDKYPGVETEINRLIDQYALVAADDTSRYSHAHSILNSTGTKFNARQLLKHNSAPWLFLMAASATHSDVVTSSLESMLSDRSFTKWVALAISDGRFLPANIAQEISAFGAANSISTTTTDKENTTMSNAAAVATPVVNPAMKAAVDAVLASAGVPMPIDALLAAVSRVSQAEADKQNAVSEYSALAAEMIAKKDEIDLLQRKVQQAQAVSTTYTSPASTATGIPSGNTVMVQASTLFPELTGLSLEIPSWTWAHAHPDVPLVNPGYIFRKDMLIKFLLAMKRGDNCWFQGHTGSGKTTFVEQVAARLQWPVARIAFDSAIDRSELVGRMQLKSDGQGGTVSEWLKGVLELAIPNGYWLLCDEFDAGRPDALYVLQEILEHKAKRLLEDGGRFIDYHPMTRVIATGNTCGSGDPSGIYPATRILSGATLDRYPVFIHVPYMTNAEEENLISQNVTLAKPMIKRMAKFATEMRQAFIKAEIPISYSPRRSVSFARATEDFLGVLGHNNMDKAMSLALQQAVYDAAPEEFKQRIVEIARSALGATIDPTTTI